MGFLAGIDVGTSGVRCMIFDLDGNVISRAYREFRSYYPKANWVEYEPLEILQTMWEVCQRATSALGFSPDEILSIGVSAQRSVLCPLREDGTPVRRMISWQDGRCQEETSLITQVISSQEYYRQCGLPVGTTWLLPKILWMKRHEPHPFAQTERFSQLGDFILHALGADGFYTDTCSCVFYGLWDVKNVCWNERLLERFELSPEQFGTPTPAATQVGEITPKVAAKTGFAVGTPLCLAAGDQNSSTVGMGAIRPGMSTVTLGTCGMVMLSMNRPVDGFHGMMVTNHAVPRLWEMEGLTNSAACAYKWLKNEVGTGTVENSYQELNTLAEQSSVGANGLIFLPYLAGAATPHWNMDARGAILGLSLAHRRADIVRAVIEGVVLEMRDIMEQWRMAGYSIHSVGIAGGATCSDLWNQIQADIYGLPVTKLVCNESTSLGSAILGGVAANVFSSIPEACDRMVHVDTVLDPIPENKAKYDEIYRQFIENYQFFANQNYEKSFVP